jgi:hypothetical protein
VTVCIAAVCPNIHHIILVSDQLISNEWISVDGVSKFDQLDTAGRWIAMYSGHEAHRFQPLVRTIREQLAGGRSMHLVMTACAAAVRIELERKVEAEILAPLSVSLKDFRGLVSRVAAKPIARDLRSNHFIRSRRRIACVGVR